MNIRRIITIILSLFVTISILFLVYNEINPLKGGPQESESIENVKRNTDIKFSEENRSIIIYYFYTSYRCQTCFKIEQYTHDAILDKFKSYLNHTIFWKPINIDKKEHEHYRKDYKLFTKSVIIEERAGTKQLRWKNLEKIWDLTGDREQFISYIQDEVIKYRD